MADFDPLAYDPIVSASRARIAQPWRRKASPEETESFARHAANMGLSGLGYVLSSIDKPARAVRGLLAGKPHEALAALPFSDTLGLTNPEDAVSGAQLNQKLFGVRDDSSWKSWGAGIATELATDPLTYLTFGTKHALTAAGKTAEKAGLLRGMSRAQKVKGFDYAEDALRAAGRSPEEIAHLGRQGHTVVPSGAGIGAHQPLAGLARVGIPGTGVGFTLGTGGTGQAVAGILDKAGEALAYRVPGAKSLSALFDSGVGRAAHEPTQRGMRAAGTPAREAAESLGRGRRYEANRAIADIVAEGRWPEAQVQGAARQLAENVPPSPLLPVDPDLWARVQGSLGGLERMGQEHLAEAGRLGIPLAALRDPFATYFPRQGMKAAEAGAGPQMRGGGLFKTTHGGMIKRKNPLREVPGGSEMLQKWSTDPTLAGPNALPFNDARARIAREMLDQAAHQGITLPDVTRTVLDPNTRQAVTTTLDHAAQLEQRAGKVARRLARHDPANPIFSRDVVGDVQLGAARQARSVAGAQGFYRTVGESAAPFQQGMVPAADLLKGIKQKDRAIRLRNTEGGPLGIQGALVEMHKALARQGAGPTEELVRNLMAPVAAAATPAERATALKGAIKGLRGEVNQFGFRPEQAEQILKDYAAWRAPEEVVRPIKGLDSFTNFFRNMAYSTWLPSHVRNALGGVVQAATQPYAPGSRDYIKAGKLLGDNSPTAQAIKGEAFRHAKVFSGFNPAETQAARAASGKITPELPGSHPVVNPITEMGKGAFQTTKDLLGTAAHPGRLKKLWGAGGALEQMGVGAGQKNFPLLEAGRKVGTQTEDFLRLANYLGMKRQGVAPAEAGRRVLETHFDYSALTPFERKVMRRAIPFYSFARRNLPLQLENMFQRPGQTILPQLRAMAPRPGQTVPSHLASGVAVPLGGEDERGNQQFLSQLGLPIEEAFERWKFRPGDPLGGARDTAYAYMGMLNPLIKGPLEQLFDTQLFSGRRLSDLRPQGMMGTLGSLVDPESRHPQGLQFLSQAMANTPATRFLTAIDRMADPRKSWWQKALNLGTGVRVSDVDMEKSRAIETRKVLESILRAQPGISQHVETYVRPEDQANLTPEVVDQLRVLSRLQSNARRAADARRHAAAQAASSS